MLSDYLLLLHDITIWRIEEEIGEEHKSMSNRMHARAYDILHERHAHGLSSAHMWAG